MSLGRNIAASYASQLYVSLLGLLVLPVYLRYLGPEAYGLVGFFVLLQAWFMVLDLGLTPTVSREMARQRGGALSARDFRRLYRALALIFAGIAVLGGGALVASAGMVATRWLDVEALDPASVADALRVMAVCVALRWWCGLFRGVVSGSERLVWLGTYNAVTATARFLGVLPWMAWRGATIEAFFTWQLAVGLAEFAWIGAKALTLLPRVEAGAIGWSFAPVRPLLRFALSIAFTSSVWVLVTQSDRLILSGVLSLSEYGYFTLAVLVASGILLVSGPVSAAVLPRLSRLHAEHRHDEMLGVYRRTTQLVAVIAGAASITLACVPFDVVHAWTGDLAVARKSGAILRLYAIGNGLLALAAFPYYLQYARGDLRWHVAGNVLTLVLLVPAIVIAARGGGAVGAGWAWLAVNAFFLVAWVAYVHHRLEPGLHVRWLGRDVLPIVGAALAAPVIIALLAAGQATRGPAFLVSMAVALAALGGAAAASSAARAQLAALARRHFPRSKA